MFVVFLFLLCAVCPAWADISFVRGCSSSSANISDLVLPLQECVYLDSNTTVYLSLTTTPVHVDISLFSTLVQCSKTFHNTSISRAPLKTCVRVSDTVSGVFYDDPDCSPAPTMWSPWSATTGIGRRVSYFNCTVADTVFACGSCDAGTDTLAEYRFLADSALVNAPQMCSETDSLCVYAPSQNATVQLGQILDHLHDKQGPWTVYIQPCADMNACAANTTYAYVAGTMYILGDNMSIKSASPLHRVQFYFHYNSLAGYVLNGYAECAAPNYPTCSAIVSVGNNVVVSGFDFYANTACVSRLHNVDIYTAAGAITAVGNITVDDCYSHSFTELLYHANLCPSAMKVEMTRVGAIDTGHCEDILAVVQFQQGTFSVNSTLPQQAVLAHLGAGVRRAVLGTTALRDMSTTFSSGSTCPDCRTIDERIDVSKHEWIWGSIIVVACLVVLVFLACACHKGHSQHIKRQ